MFISTTRNALALSTDFSIVSTGNGQSVIGRMSPTRMPFSRALLTALRAMRAHAPNATITMSASSVR